MTFSNNKENKLNKKQKYVIISIAASAFVIIFLASGIVENTTVSAVTLTKNEFDIKATATPDEFLHNRGQGAIVVSSNTKEIDAIRGSTVKTTFTITYEAGSQPISKLTVVGNKISGMLLPPSVVKSTTPQERFEAIQEGKSILGAIDLSPLVRFVPSAVVLSPGESKTVDMYIDVPKNWPDEMVNKGADFSPSFRIVEQDGSKNIGLFNDLVTVNVRG